MNFAGNIRYFLFGICIMCLCSCSKDNADDYDPDYVLRFEPAIGISTRSADLQDEVVFPKDERFRIWAYLLDSPKSWKDHASEAKSWLSGEEIAWKGQYWATMDETHWKSKQERLTIIACSPSSLEARYDMKNGIQISGFDLSKDTTDILYTDAIMDQDKVLQQGVVPVKFQHALTRMEIHMISGMPDNVSFQIKSVQVDDLYCKGDFSSAYGIWSLTEDQTSLDFCKNGPVMVDTKETYIDCFKVLPQAGERPVTLTFDLYQNGVLVLEDLILKAEPIKTPWKAGKRYVYTLRLTLEGVTYSTDILD